MVISVLGTLLLVVVVTMWVAFPPEVRAQFTTFQVVTVIVLGLGFSACGYALARSRVVARPDGLTVVNGYRTRRFEWSQLIGLSLPRGAPWATLDLSDGTSVSVMGIQGSDGLRARRAVREVRACITAHTPT